MLEFLDFQVNVCPGQAGRIKAIEVTGRMTGKPQLMPPGWQTAPHKRIIKGRPFGVGFDRSHLYLQQGAPS